MTKTEEIYGILRENIMAGKYTHGEILNELDIANVYNVSKTPAREALSLLCQEGYLVKYARKGYIVRELTLQEYAYLMQYRVILETAVVKMIIAQMCIRDSIGVDNGGRQLTDTGGYQEGQELDGGEACKVAHRVKRNEGQQSADEDRPAAVFFKVTLHTGQCLSLIHIYKKGRTAHAVLAFLL